MERVNIILMGFGRVGKAFSRLIQEKSNFCRTRFGLDLKVSWIFNTKGALVFPNGRGGKKELTYSFSRIKPEKSPFWRAGFSLSEALRTGKPGVLVECTPSDIRQGEPALSHLHQALDAGWHVAIANKGPLVVDFLGIKAKARKHQKRLGLSGATAAALPALDVALHSLAGTEMRSIEGILNGTTNYILTQIDQGSDYRTALEEAQRMGIAEPDPSFDVEGWDTAAKMLIITNVVFDTGNTLNDIHVEGITHIPSELQDRARREGKRIKLLGRFVQEYGKSYLETKVSLIGSSHPLYGVNGPEKGIVFFTDTMDSVTVTGGKSDPTGAAAALLKDIINIYRC